MLCFRQRAGKHRSGSESEEDETVVRSRKPQDIRKKVKIEEPEEEDEIDRMERERQEDLKGRDEFASRLKEKDESKTRNIVSKSGTTGLIHIIINQMRS